MQFPKPFRINNKCLRQKISTTFITQHHLKKENSALTCCLDRSRWRMCEDASCIHPSQN